MSKITNKHSKRYVFDPKSRFKNFQSTGFLGLKVIVWKIFHLFNKINTFLKQSSFNSLINFKKNNKGRFDELEEIDEHNVVTRISINKIKETTIKEMLYKLLFN